MNNSNVRSMPPDKLNINTSIVTAGTKNVLPPSSDKKAKDDLNNWEICNPENYIDQLPHPYR